MSILRLACVLSMATLLVSCTYKGGIENPVTRKFSWFSYVNADDIRKVCKDLGADRYRFVYNGVYQRQTRTYDVFFHAKKIDITVGGEANIRETKLDDLMSPWRSKTSEVLVTDKALRLLKDSLIESAALQPSPKGLRLYSDKFYWIVSACVDGEFYFNAYPWPSKKWDAITFQNILLSIDNTGVSMYEPRDLSTFEIWGSMKDADPFLLEIGKNGLVGFEGG